MFDDVAYRPAAMVHRMASNRYTILAMRKKPDVATQLAPQDDGRRCLTSASHSTGGFGPRIAAEDPNTRPQKSAPADWSAMMAYAQQGDCAAYASLLVAIAPYVRSLAARCLRRPEDAEDIVQDILLTIHVIRHTYDPHRPFGPWLTAIALQELSLKIVRFLCLVTLLSAGRAEAWPLPTGPDLKQAGWEIWTKSGVPAAHFESPGGGRINVFTESGFGLLYHEIDEADGHKRFLRWRWRLDKTMPATDLSHAEGDDRPLAVHVWFPDPEASPLHRIGQGIVGRILGVPFTGKVLTYVWGGIGQRDDKFPNPHLESDGVIIILRPGDAPIGVWFTEEVNLSADFEQAFGHSAPPPSYVAISADSDDTRTNSAGAVADLAFMD